MKKILFIAGFLWGFTSLYSQEHATCSDAIPVNTSSYGPVSPKGWADPSLCVPNNENMYFGKTHKVVWFSFIVPYDTVLTFQVVPENPTDDFDFILFKADRGDFCQKEKQREVKPIRTNFAKPTEYSKGVCGLSVKGKDAFVPPGYNSPLSSVLAVKKGDWYYLAVDSYQDDKGGFTLKLPIFGDKPAPSLNTPIAESHMDARPVMAPHIQQDTTPKPAPPTPAPPAPFKPTGPNFFIHVLDSANHPVKASLVIDGAIANQSIKVDTNVYALQLNQYQTVKIRANADGHMPYQSSYSETGDTSSVTFWVRLQPIKVAGNITLKDISFQGDSPEIMPESKPALDYILQFLLDNPNVKIIIKGYTNDPDNTGGEKYDVALSDRRANSIKNYIASHGVDRTRMKCVGYGNSKLIYPHPINEDQKVANRRVEIEIQ
jgi:outer membrane protein OmpA-like peptidoglycan-associated protein